MPPRHRLHRRSVDDETKNGQAPWIETASRAADSLQRPALWAAYRGTFTNSSSAHCVPAWVHGQAFVSLRHAAGESRGRTSASISRCEHRSTRFLRSAAAAAVRARRAPESGTGRVSSSSLRQQMMTLGTDDQSGSADLISKRDAVNRARRCPLPAKPASTEQTALPSKSSKVFAIISKWLRKRCYIAARRRSGPWPKARRMQHWGYGESEDALVQQGNDVLEAGLPCVAVRSSLRLPHRHKCQEHLGLRNKFDMRPQLRRKSCFCLMLP